MYFNGLKVRWGAVALVLCSVATFASQPLTQRSVEVNDAGTLVSVIEDQQDATLRVKIDTGDRSADWSYEDALLDPEPSKRGPVEILRAAKGRFLFIHAYSGGAHCCWSLLTFDLDRLKPLGQFISSEGSITVGKGVGGCELGASWQPPIDDPSKKVPDGKFSCFSGRGFVEAPRLHGKGATRATSGDG